MARRTIPPADPMVDFLGPPVEDPMKGFISPQGPGMFYTGRGPGNIGRGPGMFYTDIPEGAPGGGAEVLEAVSAITDPPAYAVGQGVRAAGGSDLEAGLAEFGTGLVSPGAGEVSGGVKTLSALAKNPAALKAALPTIKQAIIFGSPAIVKKVTDQLLRIAEKMGGRVKDEIMEIVHSPKRRLKVRSKFSDTEKELYRKKGHRLPQATYLDDPLIGEEVTFNVAEYPITERLVSHEVGGGHAFYSRKVPKGEKTSWEALVEKHGVPEEIQQRYLGDPPKVQAEETYTRLMEDFVAGVEPKGFHPEIVKRARRLFEKEAGDLTPEELEMAFFGPPPPTTNPMLTK